MAGLLGELPALPLHTAGKYVAGAYIVLFALVLVYVAIMAIRLGRIERDLGELLEREQAADALHASRAASGGRAQRAAGVDARHERAARAGHLAQDRAGRAARAPGLHRERGERVRARLHRHARRCARRS